MERSNTAAIVIASGLALGVALDVLTFVVARYGPVSPDGAPWSFVKRASQRSRRHACWRPRERQLSSAEDVVEHGDLKGQPEIDRSDSWRRVRSDVIRVTSHIAGGPVRMGRCP